MAIRLQSWHKWLLFWLLAVAIASGLNYQNRHLNITAYNIKDPRWPAELDGWRMVQISDLHNQAVDGPGNQRLLTAVKSLQPQIIAITGDTFDSRATVIPANLELISRLGQIAPVYLVLGNHDFGNDNYQDLINQMAAAGATILRDQAVTIGTGQQKIRLVGLDDPTVLGGPLPRAAVEKITVQKLTHIMDTAEQWTEPVILLAHRPELWTQYLTIKPLVTLSGHTHGGQFRLPWIGALYVPNQPLLPAYDQGHFMTDDSQLIISRGVGNSFINQRWDDYPEIVSLNFYHQ